MHDQISCSNQFGSHTEGSCISRAKHLRKKGLYVAQETLAWLANPSNANPDALPPGLEGFDPVPYLSAALPITVATFGTQLVHELGHRAAAYVRKASRFTFLSFTPWCQRQAVRANKALRC